jgi:SAM-dependent methyltransferase
VSRLEELAALALDVQQTEYRYLLHGDRHDPVTTPWMPYQPADFISIIWECLPELTRFPAAFLDVGCGPGTKMQIARELFHLDVFGVEVDEDMAAEARSRFNGTRVVTGDALKLLPGYLLPFEMFDIIWLYRPFRDPVSEARLEQKVIGAMKPGAILAGSSWETDVSSLGWNPVVDDCLISPDGRAQIIRGAWQKPKLS